MCTTSRVGHANEVRTLLNWAQMYIAHLNEYIMAGLGF